MEAALVFISLFIVIFGIAYLHYSTRNKERLALIERGTEASIFFHKNQKTAPIWKIFILNLALLLVGIGLGVFIAAFLNYNLGVDKEVAYPGTIFLLAGIGLFVGFNMTKELD